jgi:hypothetical protein
LPPELILEQGELAVQAQEADWPVLVSSHPDPALVQAASEGVEVAASLRHLLPVVPMMSRAATLVLQLPGGWPQRHRPAFQNLSKSSFR